MGQSQSNTSSKPKKTQPKRLNSNIYKNEPLKQDLNMIRTSKNIEKKPLNSPIKTVNTSLNNTENINRIIAIMKGYQDRQKMNIELNKNNEIISSYLKGKTIRIKNNKILNRNKVLECYLKGAITRRNVKNMEINSLEKYLHLWKRKVRAYNQHLESKAKYMNKMINYKRYFIEWLCYNQEKQQFNDNIEIYGKIRNINYYFNNWLNYTNSMNILNGNICFNSYQNYSNTLKELKYNSKFINNSKVLETNIIETKQIYLNNWLDNINESIIETKQIYFNKWLNDKEESMIETKQIYLNNWFHNANNYYNVLNIFDNWYYQVNWYNYYISRRYYNLTRLKKAFLLLKEFNTIKKMQNKYNILQIHLANTMNHYNLNYYYFNLWKKNIYI